MADEIQCPAPNCNTRWSSATPQAILLKLLEIHERTAHPAITPSTSTTTGVKAEKVKRPIVSTSGTSEEWSYFVSRWTDYKAATRLSGSDVIFQLLECCEESLRKDLTRSFTSLTSYDETTLLDCIKSLAVRQENIMVARLELQQMRQDRDEPARTFYARLKGQANICQFKIECSQCGSEPSYCDNMVRDTLITGLADDDIRLDVLGQSNQDMSLEETIRFIEAKESGKRSATRIKPLPLPSSVDASTYKQSERRRYHQPQSPEERKRIPQPQTHNRNSHSTPCGHCGKTGHGRRRQERMTHCPAFNHTCMKCNLPHHFESVCRKSQSQQSPKMYNAERHENATAVYDALCYIESDISPKEHNVNTITLEHHVYDSFCDTWQKKPSDPQPTINVVVQATPSDAKELGVKSTIDNPTKNIKISAVADTGCQSCLAGSSLLYKMGLNESHLIPTSMRMKAANQNSIEILGAIALRITGFTRSGKPKTTRQIVYITDSTNKFFLSMEACRALGIIPPTFPSVGSTSANVIASEDQSENGDNECNCPTRQQPPPIPTSLPFPPKEENREKLENWLLNHYKSSTFNVCTHQPLPMMSGTPMSLIIEDATPKAVHTPIPVPIHWQDQVKADLDRDVQLGVIEPVPVGTPVTWCHRMVVCAKKSGKPRRTVDFQALNRHATRETHHTQSPFHQARSVPPNMRKTTFDAWNGYHSIALHPEDRHLTTFITPWGRYRYCVCPQGYIASGDAYTRRFDEIVSDFPNKTKVIDDTIMWASSIEDCFFQATKWLDLCGRNGIVLNPDKFTFAKETVTFAGFEITPTKVKPCPQVIEAIKCFPQPRNITDVRSWFGLVNQVSYAFASAERMQPFRNLLKPQTKFTWTDSLNRLFEETKMIISEEIKRGVEIFDKTRPTCLATDYSKDGIGFWLLQKHCRCTSTRLFCCPSGWRISLVGSRFTSSAESRYAPIEGEALAVVDALEKTRHFVLGCPDLTIIVDHKPLIKVFGDRCLEDIPNPRLRNLKEKTLRFKFQIRHIPGIRHAAADAMSRHPVSPADHLALPDDITIGQIELDMHHSFLMSIRESIEEPPPTCCNIDESIGIRSVTWDDVRFSTNSDMGMVQLLDYVENGFPDSKEAMPQEIRNFHQYREKLTSFDGVILYNDRVIIPPNLRDKVLDSLHSAHQGVSQMCSRAECSFFWPGMTSAIMEMRSRCSACNRMAPSQPSEPPTPPIQPQYPFQCICADFFHHAGHHYLVIVDRYSNWPIVEKAKDGAQGLIASLRRTFSTYGICDELSSDGGPEFTATSTTSFLRNWGVHHRLSSVAFPHSNSRAEISVKIIKRMIVDNTGTSGTIDTNMFQRAILQYRNTPDRDTRLSPAMCVFGRPVRDFIPIHPGKYAPHQTWQETLSHREEALRNRHMRDHERLSAHTRVLPPLTVGDCVRLQNQTGPHPNKWDKTGIVIEVRQFNQYVIRVDGSGRITLRNRKFLRQYTPVIPRAPLASLPKTPIPIPVAIQPTLPTETSHPNQSIIKTPSKDAVCPPRLEPTSSGPFDLASSGSPNTSSSGPSYSSNSRPSSPTSTVASNPPPITGPALATPPVQEFNPAPAKERVPRALRALEPHNKPGLKEAQPLTRLRKK